MAETRVPVARLKARLSEYLSRVKAGETLVVTERGIPVGRLGPLDPADSSDGRIDRLERAGLVRRGSGRLPADFFDRPRPSDPEGRALKALLAEREEGF